MNRSNKIVLKLVPIDPSKKADLHNNATKPIDVNAIRNKETNLWHIRYPQNVPSPMPLQVQFTKLDKLINHASDFYSKRNLKISEMIDA